MSLGEHLEELRRRLIRGLLAVLVAFGVGWGFHERIGRVVQQPLHSVLARLEADQVRELEERLEADATIPRTRFFQSADPADVSLREEYRVSRKPLATGFGEYFIFALKNTLYFAVFAGSPVLLWQMWQFIAAGLYARERRVVRGYFPVSVMLFLSGVLFGFFVLVPNGLYYLASISPPGEVELLPRLSEYMSLLTSLTLALGAVFQLPILIYGLVRLDLVRRTTFTRYRPHFIVGSFVIAAMLTPPDPFTQFLMAVPMVGLFELGLIAARFAPRPEPAQEAA